MASPFAIGRHLWAPCYNPTGRTLKRPRVPAHPPNGLDTENFLANFGEPPRGEVRKEGRAGAGGRGRPASRPILCRLGYRRIPRKGHLLRGRGKHAKAGPGRSQSEVRQPGPVERRRGARPGSGSSPFPWRHPNPGGVQPAPTERTEKVPVPPVALARRITTKSEARMPRSKRPASTRTDNTSGRYYAFLVYSAEVRLVLYMRKSPA